MFYTYIITNRRNGTLYTGHTDDLWARVEAHKAKAFGGFSAKYNLTRLAWYEAHPTRQDAFTREQRIKNWNRAWKLELIERGNPRWDDLHDCGYAPLFGQAGYFNEGETGSCLPAGRAEVGLGLKQK